MKVVCMILLLWYVVTERIVSVEKQIVGQVKQRITHRVNLDYGFQIADVNKWQQYPDFYIQFTLNSSQYVSIFYHITPVTSTETHFLARLVLDGNIPKEFFTITGNFNYHTNRASSQIWMEAGTHVAKVEYRTPSGRYQQPSWDQFAHVFQVSYLL